jgi:hypothetical protein
MHAFRRPTSTAASSPIRFCAPAIKANLGQLCLGGQGSGRTDRRRLRVFSVRDDAPYRVLHTGGTIDFADVEGFLLELASRYELQEVRFDPRFLERSMEVLADRRHEWLMQATTGQCETPRFRKTCEVIQQAANGSPPSAVSGCAR